MELEQFNSATSRLLPATQGPWIYERETKARLKKTRSLKLSKRNESRIEENKVPKFMKEKRKPNWRKQGP